MFWLALLFILAPWILIAISFIFTRKEDSCIKKYMK